jgi:hypothetical protein
MRSLAVCLLMVGVCANSQDNFDREKSAGNTCNFVLSWINLAGVSPTILRRRVEAAGRLGKLSKPQRDAELGESISAWPRSVRLPT